ncbi:MAG TPA: hypothetical protein VF771_03360 [Longimicrobiaceae bacterium]
MTTTRLARLLAATVVIAVLVWAVGSRIVAPGDRQAVAAGVLAAAAWQALVFAVTVTALPHNRLAAFGVGMLARFLLVAVAALVAVPALKLAMGPALLSMVTVLFATTLIEPVLFAAGAGDSRGR